MIDSLLGLDSRNVYVDRLIQANKEAYKEATRVSEETKKIVLEIAEEDGWFAERDQAIIAVTARETARITARETARKLLDFGDPVDKIAVATNLPIEEIMEMA